MTTDIPNPDYRKARWFNVFGEEVDLDDIDRSYALNILMMFAQHKARQGYSRDWIESHPLTRKLREATLKGRDPEPQDRIRAMFYNARCRLFGLPYRAPTRRLG